MKGRPEVIKNIRANILLITGKHDVIVTPACAQALLPQTSSPDITDVTISGSHMGIVGGREASKESWAMIAQWLTARDSEQKASASA